MPISKYIFRITPQNPYGKLIWRSGSYNGSNLFYTHFLTPREVSTPTKPCGRGRTKNNKIIDLTQYRGGGGS